MWSSEPAVIAAVRNVHATIGGVINEAAGASERAVLAAVGADPESPAVLALLGAFRAGYWRERSGDVAAAAALSALVEAVRASDPDALAALSEAVGWE
ncbi:hypothetical protein GCM10011504_57340 [Siccirubricoccus deserti]|nr:hypothetical protein GCM10011504_57340 [Siccirubricoccus deserti]